VKSIDVELKVAAIFDGSISHLPRTTQSLNFVQAAVARCQDGSNPSVQVYPNPEKQTEPKINAYHLVICAIAMENHHL